MKAIVFYNYGSSEVLQLKEVEIPTPKDNEVLIKVRATSINDWDWQMMLGKPYITRLIIGLRKPKINIPGVDVAGQVEAVGKDVKKFQAGDEVFGDLSESGFGAFAEYVCASEKSLIVKPTAMSFEQAAALPHAAMLAVQGLIDKGQLQSGQKLLINGAGGGVGTLGIQIAKLLGVEVTGVDSSDKLDTLKAMGYDHVIDYKQKDYTQNTKRYDLILDVKTNRPISHYARALKTNGRYVTVGGSMSRVFQAVLLGPWYSLLHKKYISVLGLKPNKDMAYINELFEAGKIKPVIEGPYTLSEIPEFINYFGEGRHTGKVVISLKPS